MSDKYNVLINGASGFVGLELIKLLSNHKFISLKYLCSRGSIGKSINSFLKSAEGKKILNNTPVVTINGSRNMWFMAQEKIKILLKEANAVSI